MRTIVFDSGVGGLPILYNLKSQFPNADFCYVSDTEHLPYGMREPDEVACLACQKISSAKAADCIVIACNTVTAVAISTLRAKFQCPVFGIEPAVKPALQATARSVTVLCTPATLRAKNWTNPRVEAVALGCLAQKIEQVIRDDRPKSELAALAREVGATLREDVVLGCTHYAFLADALERSGHCVFDGAKGLVDNIARVLRNEGSGQIEFLDSEDALTYQMLIDKGLLFLYTE